LTGNQNEPPPPESGEVVSFSTARKAPRPKKVGADPNDARPIIHLERGDIERIVDESERTLIAANRGLYQRDGLIVSVVEAPAIAADGARIIVQRIAEVRDHAVVEHLGSSARFTKWDARANANVVADPPIWIAQTLRERKSRRFPVLTGVINSPTLRADGSILKKPGYDEATGLLFDPRGVKFPSIPSRPTREQARAALGTLEDVIKEFPFITGVDRSVALSAMVTAPVRRSLRSAPMHGFSAPVAGAGKSKLVDIASVIATGHEAAVIAQGKTAEEFEKRLGALLLAGAPIIAIDNVEVPLGGELLCQCLTQERVRPRILGQSMAPETSTGAFFAATGNNLVLIGDLIRRAILCRLDPKCERPETRVFDRDPVAHAKASHPALVTAGLTILRAYIAAGQPAKPARLGSFEDWSDLVRGTLIWLGCADPVESMESIRECDLSLARLGAVMSQWRAVIGAERATAGDIIKRASDFAHPDFREALLAVAGHNGAINSRSLGIWLSRVEGRIVDGCRFEQSGHRQRAAIWALTDA
jgi:hypothetical protein